MTSPDAITDEMIRALRDKALDSEDGETFARCTVALGHHPHASPDDISDARRWCMDRLLAGMKGGAK